MTSLAHLPVSGKSNLFTPENFFIPHPDASDDDAREVALMLLEQAQSGLALLLSNGGSSSGFTIDHKMVYSQLCALNKLVSQVTAALHHYSVGEA